MKEKLNIFIILELFHLISAALKNWRDYPACRLGRLQSPIEIKESESSYSNDFSFVYQNYKKFLFKEETNSDYAYVLKGSANGGYINFEKGGVIKQYELQRFEIYPGLHYIDGDKGDYELHIVHKKNLDFVTNKNQYRSIQDANMYLVVVLRYKTECSNIPCTSDNGLLDIIKSDSGEEMKEIELNKYSIFQEKRAFFYEGSSLHIPCDENVNYYIVKDFFKTEKINKFTENDIIKPSNKFGRPIYKNFMNYKEVMRSNYISIKTLSLFGLLFILF